MMEAMALEVEEIEKTKGEEAGKLQSELGTLQKLCAHYKQTSAKMFGSLQKLGEAVKVLAKDYKANAAQYRKELNDMG
jgi:peptidoglycan hydrolase CwlO-like protein